MVRGRVRVLDRLMRGGMGFIICGEYVIIRIGPSGEIGIHVCLRSICHLVCRFKSCLGHQITIILTRGLDYFVIVWYNGSIFRCGRFNRRNTKEGPAFFDFMEATKMKAPILRITALPDGLSLLLY